VVFLDFLVLVLVLGFFTTAGVAVVNKAGIRRKHYNAMLRSRNAALDALNDIEGIVLNAMRVNGVGPVEGDYILDRVRKYHNDNTKEIAQ
jgi:hypothetical protein